MAGESVRAVVTDPGGDGLRVGDIALRAPATNEALVRVTAFSLNRGEVKRAMNAAEAGNTVGWDITGTVAMPAADGSGPAEGVRVVGFCRRMDGWAERVYMPTSDLAPLPDAVTFEQAATLPVAGLTALHCIDTARALLGRKALITGASGGVGMFAIQLAKHAGAHVTAQVRSAEKAIFARALGADEVLITDDGESFVEHGPFRFAMDSIGGPLLANAVKALDKDGVCVTYGVSASDHVNLPIGDLFRHGRAALRGLHLYATSEIEPPSAAFPRLFGFLESGRLDCRIDRVTDWSEIAGQARDLMDRKFDGKAVLTISDG